MICIDYKRRSCVVQHQDFFVFHHREVHVDCHQICKYCTSKLEELAQEILIKYIHHYVSASYMFILNTVMCRWEAVKLIFLRVEFSEIFLKGLYVTLSLKHCILLNSCSGTEFSAKQIL